jgi:hypothetical protein
MRPLPRMSTPPTALSPHSRIGSSLQSAPRASKAALQSRSSFRMSLRESTSIRSGNVLSGLPLVTIAHEAHDVCRPRNWPSSSLKWRPSSWAPLEQSRDRGARCNPVAVTRGFARPVLSCPAPTRGPE